ncbi:MAG: phospholipase D-like domain-containing protein [Candidatus Bipolaricaulota bacterium]
MRKRGNHWIRGLLGVAAATLAVWGSAQSTSVWPLLGPSTPGGVRDALGRSFAAAERSIEVLLSTFDVAEGWIVEALGDARERGVRVRVMLDGSSWSPSITERNRPALEALLARGVEARFDDMDTTTHAKLAIVDRATVILGSTNWNHYALTEHAQADVRVDDPRVAEAFAVFFDCLWAGTGRGLEVSFPEPPPVASGPAIVALPDADGTLAYGSFALGLIGAARRSVHVSMYRVSVYPAFDDSLSNQLVDALVAAAGRGLDVRVLLDDCSFYEDSAAENLESAITLYQRGIPVRFDAPDVTTHAKLLVVDGEHVLLGSTNWNYYSIERNVEANVAFIGLPDVAARYDAYFEGLYGSARSIGP